MSSRSGSPLRRRIVMGVLALAALVLITISFREGDDGPLHSVQGAISSALQPLEVAVERVSRPFRDAYGWTASIFGARGEAERLQGENERLRQAVIQNESALRENVELRRLLDYRDGPSFPRDYQGLPAAVVVRPASAFEQQIVVAVGAADGVQVHATVVTAEGLVGEVSRVEESASVVTLLTDETSAVSAVDLRTDAAGIVRHGQSGDSLVLDRVKKEEVVHQHDEIVTAGWRTGRLTSLYPKNIPIGQVTSVGLTDTDLYQQVQIQPYVDFSKLDSVLVLVPRRPMPTLP
jgi:rod shape-determining protein MreC